MIDVRIALLSHQYRVRPSIILDEWTAEDMMYAQIANVYTAAKQDNEGSE